MMKLMVIAKPHRSLRRALRYWWPHRLTLRLPDRPRGRGLRQPARGDVRVRGGRARLLRGPARARFISADKDHV